MIKNIKQEFNLYDILQNVAIGALACHSFVQGYCVLAVSKNNKSNFPKLEYLFYVLPIVYHQDTMRTFKSSTELYTALVKNKSILLGLQDRANKMSPQTFDALNLAFNKELLSINEKNVFNLAGTNNNQSNWHVNSSDSVEVIKLRAEVEKLNMFLEQQTKEILYLKEIIELLNNFMNK